MKKKARIDESKKVEQCRGPSHEREEPPIWKGSDEVDPSGVRHVICYGMCPKCIKPGAEYLKEHEDECNKK